MIYLLTFVFAMISLIWLFQTVFLDSFYKSIKTRNISVVASQIENELSSDALQQSIDTLSTDHEVCIRVIQLINQDTIPANIQYLTRERSACAVARLTDEQVLNYWQKTRENQGIFVSETVEVIPVGNVIGGKITYKETGNQDIILAKSLGVQGLDGLVLVSARLSPVSSTVETLRFQLIVITGIICLMAVLLAAFMTLKVTKPLEEINKAARILGTGNYDVQFKASGYQEIDELNETMNTAALKLKQVDQMRRDLLSNVSHDLRTPLTMIEGYSEMMRDLPGENTPENAQVIIDEAHRLTLLVNDLLDLSKLQENKIELHIDKANMTSILRSIVDRYQKYMEFQGFEILLDVEENLFVLVDEKRIEQVLYNFINNAIQYSGTFQKIEIRATNKNQKVRVEVQDYGEGIPEDKLDLIWERYYKIDKEHVRAHSGSGIGLSICKEILKLHHAQYGVISKQNSGTIFWFELEKSNSL